MGASALGASAQGGGGRHALVTPGLLPEGGGVATGSLLPGRDVTGGRDGLANERVPSGVTAANERVPFGTRLLPQETIASPPRVVTTMKNTPLRAGPQDVGPKRVLDLSEQDDAAAVSHTFAGRRGSMDAVGGEGEEGGGNNPSTLLRGTSAGCPFPLGPP